MRAWISCCEGVGVPNASASWARLDSAVFSESSAARRVSAFPCEGLGLAALLDISAPSPSPLLAISAPITSADLASLAGCGASSKAGISSGKASASVLELVMACSRDWVVSGEAGVLG